MGTFLVVALFSLLLLPNQHSVFCVFPAFTNVLIDRIPIPCILLSRLFFLTQKKGSLS